MYSRPICVDVYMTDLLSVFPQHDFFDKTGDEVGQREAARRCSDGEHDEGRYRSLSVPQRLEGRCSKGSGGQLPSGVNREHPH